MSQGASLDDQQLDENEDKIDNIKEKGQAGDFTMRLRGWAYKVDWSLVVLFAIMAAYIAFFTTLSLYRYINFRASGLDIAIFDQVIWKLSRFSSPTSTIRGMSLFGDHMAPILFFLVPFYWIGRNAATLLVIQTVALGIGALPLYLLARDKLESRWVPVAVAGAYLMFPALQQLNMFDFHPETLALCFLLFAFLAIDRGKNVWFIVLCVLAAFCKEDMALAVCVLGLLVYFKYDKKVGAAVAGGSAAYFLLSILVLIPAFAPEGYQYGGRLTQFGDSTLDAVKNMVIHPVHTFTVLATRQNLSYFFQLFVPVAFISFLGVEYLLPALPAFLVNLVSDYAPQHTINFQYTAAIIPFVFIAVVFGLKRIKICIRSAVHPKLVMTSLGLILLGCSLAGNFYWGPSPISEAWAAKNYSSDSHTRALQEAVEKIPKSASVSSQVYLLPHLSERQDLYMFPNPFIDLVDREYLEGLEEDEVKYMFPGGVYKRFTGEEGSGESLPEVEYIVVDEAIDSWPLSREQYQAVIGRLLESGIYQKVYDDKGILILQKQKPESKIQSISLVTFRRGLSTLEGQNMQPQPVRPQQERYVASCVGCD